jgi:hypothetical protein
MESLNEQLFTATFKCAGHAGRPAAISRQFVDHHSYRDDDL